MYKQPKISIQSDHNAVISSTLRMLRSVLLKHDKRIISQMAQKENYKLSNLHSECVVILVGEYILHKILVNTSDNRDSHRDVTVYSMNKHIICNS